MHRRNAFLSALLTSTVLFLTKPTLAAKVTPDRLINADKEPHNWLDESPHLRCAAILDARQRSTKTNVKSLKLA